MSQADFSCAICYESATEPVVTRCGHLFCWACLNQWLHRPESVPECPVCRGHVDDRVQGSIIPLYGKGNRTHTSSSSSSSAHQQQQRPAADRAPPPERHAWGHRHNNPLSLGLGGSFFFITGSMSSSIIIIIIWAIYHFSPWREWAARAQEVWRRVFTNLPPSSQQQQSPLDQQNRHPRHSRSQQETQPGGGDDSEQISSLLIVRNVLLCVFAVYIFHFVALTS